MGILITILVVIGSIIACLLLIALLTPKDFKLTKDIVINRPKQDVFDYLRLIRNQEQYSVWVMRDPAIQIVYTGTDGTPGFTSSWVSHDKNVGVGEQEIKNIVEGESVEMEIRFKKPFVATNYARTTLTALSATETKASQTFWGHSKFPMNLMNMMMDKLVGKDMQQNLVNLKKNLEQ